MAVGYINFDPSVKMYRVHFTEPDPAVAEMADTLRVLSGLQIPLTITGIGTHHAGGRYIGFGLLPGVDADEALAIIKWALRPPLTATALVVVLSYAVLNCHKHSHLTLDWTFAPGLAATPEATSAVVRHITAHNLTTLLPPQAWRTIPVALQSILGPIFVRARIFVQRLEFAIDYLQGECQECTSPTS